MRQGVALARWARMESESAHKRTTPTRSPAGSRPGSRPGSARKDGVARSLAFDDDDDVVPAETALLDTGVHQSLNDFVLLKLDAKHRATAALSRNRQKLLRSCIDSQYAQA
eukprot:COSAG06_NODE_34202_length_478_cov_0.738786_2_plen_110_part_01